MTKQNSKQSTTHTSQDKTRQHQPLVALTEVQLEAISGGIITVNHNETMVKTSKTQSVTQTSQDKTRQPRDFSFRPK